MLNVIHAADLHLDSPFSGLSPEQAAQRREEQRELPDRLADLANERQADLVLLAGDLFDGARCTRETVQRLTRALGRICAPVFIAPGNHDPYTPDSPYAQPVWPDNVHIFTSPIPQKVVLEELGCTVYGGAFTREHPERGPLDDFCAREDGNLRFMVTHGNTLGEDYGRITPAQIRACGLTYLALGHIHQCSGLQRTGDTFWAYPGCPEGRGFDETGDKGVLHVMLDGQGAQAQFLSLCRRRYEILDVDVTHAADLLACVEQALPAQTGDHLFRIRLTGQAELAAAQLDRLAKTLSPRFYALELQDHTRTPQRVWERAGEDSLTGLFLSAMAQQPEGELRELAVRFGLSALEQGEDVSP